jgi:hypothetical protein
VLWVERFGEGLRKYSQLYQEQPSEMGKSIRLSIT